ncbi:MAG TPA: glycosyltransferase family 4 protein [Solirubrobacteraceae bacterium]|nr:glycosyltransferase family 4 protein [Solirubrobacteraceae bacterium]
MPAATLLELARHGPAPLVDAAAPASGALRIATVIPSFRLGSGGHATIVRLMRGLRARGHEVSLWLEDCEDRHAGESPTLTERSFERFFGAEDLPLHTGFERWQGADVVLATGWQTVARTLLLPGAQARAYLVQDHEPDFYPTSAEALWAAQTYRLGLPCIAASEWLARLLRERYGANACHFDLAADRDLYRPSLGERRKDLVVFYARAVTPRRAVPLGLAALAELAARRPGVDIALYGESSALHAPFAHRQLGVLSDSSLAELYAQATVGMVLSLTNPSLTGLEMMACGLPCVELASDSMLATFGRDGPLVLSQPDPLQLCAAIERLLDDPAAREQTSRDGVELMARRSWRTAAEQVERGLRLAATASVG